MTAMLTLAKRAHGVVAEVWDRLLTLVETAWYVARHPFPHVPMSRTTARALDAAAFGLAVWVVSYALLAWAFS